MLQLAVTPDQVFHALLGEALEWAIEDLVEYQGDPTAYPSMFPRASQGLTSSLALFALEQLKVAHADSELYAVKRPHVVLLADVLWRFCLLYNDDPLGTRLHERFRLQRVELDQLLEIFLHGHEVGQWPLADPIKEADLHPQRLDSTLPREPIPFELSPWYRPGLLAYPATAGTA